jgi:hypothetical protein
MSHCKSYCKSDCKWLTRFSFCLILFSSQLVWAQADLDEGSGSTRQNRYAPKTFAVSFMSWTETLKLASGSTTDSSSSNFIGYAITWEKEQFGRRWGSAGEISGLMGQANAGGRQSQILYQANNKSYFGAEASYRLAYRVSAQVTMAAGPFALVRSVSLPSTDTNGVNIDVKSGSSSNYGLQFNFNCRLTRHLEVRQMIGTLASNASTIWSLGLGYKY